MGGLSFVETQSPPAGGRRAAGGVGEGGRKDALITMKIACITPRAHRATCALTHARFLPVERAGRRKRHVHLLRR